MRTYDIGNGYPFVYTMDGTVVSIPGFKAGDNRLNVLVNGRAIARELRDGVVPAEALAKVQTLPQVRQAKALVF